MRTKILSVAFDRVDMEQAIGLVQRHLGGQAGEKLQVVTANPEIVMTAEADEQYRRTIAAAGLVVADGIGVVIASWLIGRKLPMRVAGYDLVTNLLRRSSGVRVFLLGAAPDTVVAAAERVAFLFPGIEVVGYQHCYFPVYQQSTIIERINSLNPDLLLVALGCPRQELWIGENLPILSCKVAIGVGGTLDVWSGKVKRAPLIWQKLAIEWLYRLIRQPSRWRRMLVLPKFMLMVLWRGWVAGRQ
ncbi:MAG: WecB/TagA/CpsF family glycosyltransferase [Negativicutes bacterium]|nr:WecB/TagA/CpsF family glycosyltransferase [Negativicutes bacterium]